MSAAVIESVVELLAPLVIESSGSVVGKFGSMLAAVTKQVWLFSQPKPSPSGSLSARVHTSLSVTAGAVTGVAGT